MSVIIVKIILIQIQLKWLCWWSNIRNSNYENLKKILIHLIKKKKTETETNEIWIDKQSVTMIQEMIEWETENDNENVLNIDDK